MKMIVAANKQIRKRKKKREREENAPIVCVEGDGFITGHD